ncbi:MAG: alanine--glyoxylate aminotransferase family protein [Elusimicrobiota bacterium]
MRRLLLTPGPTPLPPSVLKRLGAPILHHRTREFKDLFAGLQAGLKSVFRTRRDVLVMAASGTGAMESAVCNLLSANDRVVVHVTGVFGERFVKIVRAYGLDPVVLEEAWGDPADPGRLRETLRRERGVRAVFFQHVDTSTAVVNDVRALADVVRKESDALTVVDAVSSLGGERLETDGWALDVVVSASQKGLMCPPGLAYACVGDRAWAVSSVCRSPRFYFDWRAMRKGLPESQTPFTPAISIVTAQCEALRLMSKHGLPRIWAKTASLAEHTRAGLRKMGLELFSKAPAHVLTAACLPEGVDGKALIRDVRAKTGISMAGGQGRLEGRIVRIAHMGHINRRDVDAGLKALKAYLHKA